MPYEPMVVVPDTYRATGTDKHGVKGEAACLTDYMGEVVRVLQEGETVIVLPSADADTLVMFQAWVWMLKKMEGADAE